MIGTSNTSADINRAESRPLAPEKTRPLTFGAASFDGYEIDTYTSR